MDKSAILQLERDDTCAETEFCLFVKWTGPSNSAGVTVQSTIGSQGMCINWYCAGQAMFRSCICSLDTHPILLYPLHFPFHV